MLNLGIKSRYDDTKSGYIKLYLDDGKVVEEHRYIMVQFLQRELDYDEVVHHKDGNKRNNDISNLELVSRKEHAINHNIFDFYDTHTQLTCEDCGSIFYMTNYTHRRAIKQGRTKFFCSKRCGAIYNWRIKKLESK